MATIGFIGLGNMGAPMAANLVKAGHRVTGFDLVTTAVESLAAKGEAAAASAAAAAAERDRHHDAARRTAGPLGLPRRRTGCSPMRRKDALLIDCSTIDVETARAVAAAAAEAGFDMLDAPVSGGVAGAEAATLTFMVGGEDGGFCPRASRFCRRWGRRSSMPGRPATARRRRSATT